MKIGRRGFLKILGGTAAAAVAAPLITPAQGIVRPGMAPLYVPPQNLDYGVPQRSLSLSTDIEAAKRTTTISWKNVFLDAEEIAVRVPMLLRQSEFIPEFGGKLPAGAEVMVDQMTADRWVRNHVAVPGSNAPRDLQEQSAKRLAARSQDWRGDDGHMDTYSLGVFAPLPEREPTEMARVLFNDAEAMRQTTARFRKMWNV